MDQNENAFGKQDVVVDRSSWPPTGVTHFASPGCENEKEESTTTQDHRSRGDSTPRVGTPPSPQAGAANEDRNPVLHGTEMHEMHMETGQ